MGCAGGIGNITYAKNQASPDGGGGWFGRLYGQQKNFIDLFQESSMPAEVDAAKCDGCGTCAENCPTDAIAVDGKTATVKAEDCIDCNMCQDGCPQKAIEMKM
jgi:NAD-dependent dihydropyrimidine dehydrogenase PreA subunit